MLEVAGEYLFVGVGIIFIINGIIFFLFSRKHGALMFISLIFLMSSLFFSVSAQNKDSLKNMQIGVPLKFIVQDQSRYDPPSFPWKGKFSSPWENPTRVFIPQLTVSFFFFFTIVEILYFFAATVKKKRNLGDFGVLPKK